MSPERNSTFTLWKSVLKSSFAYKIRFMIESARKCCCANANCRVLIQFIISHLIQIDMISTRSWKRWKDWKIEWRFWSNIAANINFSSEWRPNPLRFDYDLQENLPHSSWIFGLESVLSHLSSGAWTERWFNNFPLILYLPLTFRAPRGRASH